MAKTYQPEGVLLVGSVPLPSSKEVFTKMCGALPGRLRTVPDGEPGERWNYIEWQHHRFPVGVWQPHYNPPYEDPNPEISFSTVKPTLYDVAAIASYAEFVELRKQGTIPSGLRFQICLPTPTNALACTCKAEYLTRLEPFYVQRFKETLENIAKNIPHDDMVIQWDISYEISAMEFETGRYDNPWFDCYYKPVKQGAIQRLVDLIKVIPSDVPQALHLCYGDLDHKHFIQPLDLSLLVDFANSTYEAVGNSHHVEWVQMPVPPDRMDAAYFEPLKNLRTNNTRLYLGLIHPNDESGTLERIRTAHTIYQRPFGVSTECGMGRTPMDEVESILNISRAVTAPISDELS